MSKPPPTISVELPAELVERLTVRANAMKLGLPAYLTYLELVDRNGHDRAFRDATRFVFSKYGDALRKLSQ